MYRNINKLTLIKIDEFLSLLDVYINDVLQNRFFLDLYQEDKLSTKSSIRLSTFVNRD